MYALADVNSFYASCELLWRPDLRGRPIVVLSNNDGCVVARNQEAKALGMAMTGPYFKVRQQLERAGGVAFSSNYELYADMSARVMTILEALVPRVEIYSIDESFLDLSSLPSCHNLEQFGRQLRKKVLRETGLTVGVGIAQTKTLAKLANFAAKKWEQTGGVVDLSSLDRQRKLMNKVLVEEVWGIGRRIAKKLNAIGIETALQLADASTTMIRKRFSVVIERTVRELGGEPCLELEEFAPTKQQIISSRSFGERITEYEHMHQAICLYATRAAEKLRAERQYCRHVSAWIKTSPFATHEAYYGNSASIKLNTPTQDTRDIIAAAMRCLDTIWQPGHRFDKGGVMLQDFFSQGIAQLDMFDEYQPRNGSDKLMQVMDSINNSGRAKLWFAGQGTQQVWSMKRELLSPAYTTRLSDLPRARVY
ncbi:MULTISPECIES: translesion error-prone DNA polymerase V subunit UmuC [unclassified Serratia (in: enterobacteria)]|uniref:translesion error-prone DNA polymerase V subunit UmuC n=1 Tax=unclassified Serratia (in: enterobacteria) TaxID=2647522 RepID=UPI000469C205|nr:MULTISPECIES: translesion error-prone DNA polymerase V subunit UmuC [unclassified Serratia (in: enterobacteria)]